MKSKFHEKSLAENAVMSGTFICAICNKEYEVPSGIEIPSHINLKDSVVTCDSCGETVAEALREAEKLGLIKPGSIHSVVESKKRREQ